MSAPTSNQAQGLVAKDLLPLVEAILVTRYPSVEVQRRRMRVFRALLGPQTRREIATQCAVSIATVDATWREVTTLFSTRLWSGVEDDYLSHAAPVFACVTQALRNTLDEDRVHALLGDEFALARVAKLYALVLNIEAPRHVAAANAPRIVRDLLGDVVAAMEQAHDQ
jgi:hypothetical protein